MKLTRNASLCFTYVTNRHYMSLCCTCNEKQLNSRLVSIDILPSRTLRLVYRCKAKRVLLLCSILWISVGRDVHGLNGLNLAING